MYANYLFYILSFCLKCFIFHFFSCGIHTHIPILAGVQNGRISGYKNGHILLKNEPLKLHLQEEGHLHANCLFYILSFYPKFPLSQFFSRKIRMHIPILRGVQNGCISRQKQSYFANKCSFWRLFFQIKVACKPIVCFILWLFTIDAFFCSSYIVAYVCTFPS